MKHILIFYKESMIKAAQMARLLSTQVCPVASQLAKLVIYCVFHFVAKRVKKAKTKLQFNFCLFIRRSK